MQIHNFILIIFLIEFITVVFVGLATLQNSIQIHDVKLVFDILQF